MPFPLSPINPILTVFIPSNLFKKNKMEMSKQQNATQKKLAVRHQQNFHFKLNHFCKICGWV